MKNKINQMFADDLLTNRTGNTFKISLGTSIEDRVQLAFKFITVIDCLV